MPGHTLALDFVDLERGLGDIETFALELGDVRAGGKGLLGIEITDTHLVSANDEGNLMFGDHHWNILHAARSFGEPS